MRLITLATLLIAAQTAIAQNQTGYKIDFTVKGLKDTVAFLGFYYGEQTFLKDTARVNGQGAFTFDGKKPLAQGVYFMVLDKTRMVDFVVGHDQFFTLETSTDDYVKNMKVTGDDDNRLFFENMLFNMERNSEAEPWLKILQDSTLKDEAKKTAAREELKKINEKVLAFQNGVIEKYPQTLTARIFKAGKQIEVPDPPTRADGTIDSTFQFRYYRDHYFDYFDLADDALIRLPKPIYTEKLKDYLDRLFLQDPDTLMKAITALVDKVKKNQETFKYLVWNCILHYQTPKIMGLDEVYIKLFDRYFATGEMDFWLDKKIRQNMKDYADKLRLATLGRTAPNLIMQDASLQPRSMYDIKKRYTILWIFDPGCGHCREETPKLVNFYNANKDRFSVEVYAVSTDTSLQKMRDFIKEMKTTWITVNGPRTYVGTYNKLYYADTTPTMYIIDDRKKIIAKKLAVDQLEDFLTRYEKFQRPKTAEAKAPVRQ
jgi:thiol-disulfide isomerase/thioredoxin